MATEPSGPASSPSPAGTISDSIAAASSGGHVTGERGQRRLADPRQQPALAVPDPTADHDPLRRQGQHQCRHELAELAGDVRPDGMLRRQRRRTTTGASGDRRPRRQPFDAVAVVRADAGEVVVCPPADAKMAVLGVDEPVHGPTVDNDATADAGPDRQVDGHRAALGSTPADLGERRAVDVVVEADGHVEAVGEVAAHIDVRPADLRRRRDVPEVGTPPIEADRAEAPDSDGGELMTLLTPRGELGRQGIEGHLRLVGRHACPVDDGVAAGQHGDRLGTAELDSGDERRFLIDGEAWDVSPVIGNSRDSCPERPPSQPPPSRRMQIAAHSVMIFCMRTTVDLPEELLRRARIQAAEEGTTLTALLADGLQLRLRRRHVGSEPNDVVFPARGPAVAFRRGSIRLPTHRCSTPLTSPVLLPDVNVLLAAFRTRPPPPRSWWRLSRAGLPRRRTNRVQQPRPRQRRTAGDEPAGVRQS